MCFWEMKSAWPNQLLWRRFVHAPIIQNWSFVLPFLKAWRMIRVFTSLFISTTPPFKIKSKFSASCRVLLFLIPGSYSVLIRFPFLTSCSFLRSFSAGVDESKRFFPWCSVALQDRKNIIVIALISDISDPAFRLIFSAAPSSRRWLHHPFGEI